ncbi:MAG: hypothetical protein GXP47_05325 [Acidobacteria bacterium]|nr:hypothetical protein [Acidobacteriota bacterium]
MDTSAKRLFSLGRLLLVLAVAGLVSSVALAQENALDFDGTDDGVIATNVSGLAITGDLTAAAWIHVNETGQVQDVVRFGGVGEDQATNVLYQLSVMDDGSLRFFWETGAGTDHWVQTGPGVVAAGACEYVAAVRDSGAGTVTFYVNGEVVGSPQSVGMPDGGTNAVLSVGFDSDVAHFFDGQIDELSLWDAALPQSSIQTMMRQRPDPVSAGLVLLYSMSQADGDVQDATGNGHTGVRQGPNGSNDTPQFVPSTCFRQAEPVPVLGPWGIATLAIGLLLLGTAVLRRIA